ncbi:MAG: hypothetical protein ACSHYF_15470 [Verrucomicrobiaceae bacterium]
MISARLFVALFVSGLPHAVLAEEKVAPLVFSAMGCGPYSPADLRAAQYYVGQENRDGTSQFLIHLGDICTGQSGRDGSLTGKTYTDIKDLFTKGNTIPSYIVPGDNEWNDRPDPEVGWALWSEHLLGLEKNFQAGWVTERQQERPENFAFVANGVLVIGINLPGGRVHDPGEWARRFGENNAWIEAQFAKHQKEVRAAIVCAQANPVGQGRVKVVVNALFTPFTKSFVKLAAGFEKPVLFLHADGHTWTVDHPWEDARNVTRVQVDRLEPNFPPVQITVDVSAEEPFRFERRLEDEVWKVPAPPK